MPTSGPWRNYFVPQFLLSQWAVNDGHLVRFYRPFKEVKAVDLAPKGVAYRKNLYTLEGYPAQHRAAIETEYMSPLVDAPAARALDVLIARDETRLTPELREAWVRFLMSLRARHPSAIAQITAETQAGLREKLLADPEEYDRVCGPSDPPTLLEWVERLAPTLMPNFGKNMLPDLIENGQVGTLMLRMKWSTVEVTQAFPDFLLGDRPLVMTHGLWDPRCVVALPMSPRFLFLATHTSEVAAAVLDNTGPGLTTAVNESTVLQAVDDVYGTTKRHLRFVENRLRASPAGLTVTQQ
jgi:hypothetical protein